MELRDKIATKAGLLFIERGVKQVTMDTIAQSLGISKRTIYENYKDKNDLLRNVLIQATINHKEKVVEIIKNSKNVIEALFNFGEFNKETFQRINPLFFDDIKKYHSDIFEQIMNNDQVRNHEISYTLLKRGINEGVFIKTIDINLANRFIHNTMDFFNKVAHEEKMDHRIIWETVFLPYIKGICTEKGTEILKGFAKQHAIHGC
jgi:TetR/AcrR family transcriptional regulator, cholesterol catabolism regulator